MGHNNGREYFIMTNPKTEKIPGGIKVNWETPHGTGSVWVYTDGRRAISGAIRGNIVDYAVNRSVRLLESREGRHDS